MGSAICNCNKNNSIDSDVSINEPTSMYFLSLYKSHLNPS